MSYAFLRITCFVIQVTEINDFDVDLCPMFNENNRQNEYRHQI